MKPSFLCLSALVGLGNTAGWPYGNDITSNEVLPEEGGMNRRPSGNDNAAWSNKEETKTTVLDMTNKYRREHGATDVTWDKTMADAATKHANKLSARGCRGLESSDHSSRSERPGQGENLALAETPKNAIEMWGEERDQYDYNNPLANTAAGHFTQLVWKATTKIGCGYSPCDERSAYLVCRYSPAGNVNSGNDELYKKNVGRRVSDGSPQTKQPTSPSLDNENSPQTEKPPAYPWPKDPPSSSPGNDDTDKQNSPQTENPTHTPENENKSTKPKCRRRRRRRSAI